MSEIEFEQVRSAFVAGKMSRRRFVSRLIAGGVTVSAAMAFADSASAAPGSGGSPGAAVYGNPAGLYGKPPGQGGTPPGQGGTPPPLDGPTPGQGGTPPGQGGAPPGRFRSWQRRAR